MPTSRLSHHHITPLTPFTSSHHAFHIITSRLSQHHIPLFASCPLHAITPRSQPSPNHHHLKDGDGVGVDDTLVDVGGRPLLAGLLHPPLDEVLQHVPGHGALDAAVDVVPGLPRPDVGRRRLGVRVAKVAVVVRLEGGEDVVLGVVVPAASQVQAA